MNHPHISTDKIAFWKYDSPPFVLSGKLKEIHNDGSITVEGYTDCCFTKEAVLAILPIKEAKILESEIKASHHMYTRIHKESEQILLNIRQKLIEHPNNERKV